MFVKDSPALLGKLIAVEGLDGRPELVRIGLVVLEVLDHALLVLHAGAVEEAGDDPLALLDQPAAEELVAQLGVGARDHELARLARALRHGELADRLGAEAQELGHLGVQRPEAVLGEALVERPEALLVHGLQLLDHLHGAPPGGWGRAQARLGWGSAGVSRAAGGVAGGVSSAGSSSRAR